MMIICDSINYFCYVLWQLLQSRLPSIISNTIFRSLFSTSKMKTLVETLLASSILLRNAMLKSEDITLFLVTPPSLRVNECQASGPEKNAQVPLADPTPCYEYAINIISSTRMFLNQYRHEYFADMNEHAWKIRFSDVNASPRWPVAKPAIWRRPWLSLDDAP